MDPLVKNVLVWAAIILAVLLLYRALIAQSAAPELMNPDGFAAALEAGRVAEVTLPAEARIEGTLTDKGPDGKPVRFIATAPAWRDLVDTLTRHNVAIRYGPSAQDPRSRGILTLISWGPIVAVICLWLIFMRTMTRQKRDGDRPGYPGVP